jgi:glycosyltransferase involved in cell wall biosynthesis
MRICFISGALPEVSCGIGDYTDALARALARQNHEVVVVTTASPDLRPGDAYRVVALKTDWSLGEAGRIAAAARREGAEVLHLQFPGVGYGRGLGACFVPWAVRLRGHAPLLATTLHEFDRFRFRYRARLALAVAACNLVVAPDPAVLSSVRQHLRWRPRQNLELIPVAANVWPIGGANAGAEAGEPGDRAELTVGYWGFIRQDKGVDRLLEAFAAIRRVRPALLILAGDPGPDETCIQSIRRLADELGITDAISTTGRIPADQLSAVLASFDVCVLPFREGLTQNRTTYAGAVAHGLYVVTTATSKRGFEPGTNTTYVPPGDQAALAAAILDAPAHPRRRRVETAESQWDRIAELHLEAYARAQHT